MVAFKAMDIIYTKLCACQQPETSILLIFMESGTLNVLFFLILLSTSLCFLPPAPVHVFNICDDSKF